MRVLDQSLSRRTLFSAAAAGAAITATGLLTGTAGRGDGPGQQPRWR